jgi:hypothetical protein
MFVEADPERKTHVTRGGMTHVVHPRGSRLLMSFKTARAGAGSSEVPGPTLSLRLPTQVGCGSFMACGPAGRRGEAWLKKGLLSSK